MSAYDTWLAHGEPGEAAAEEWEVMERWAATALPDLDWSNEAAVQSAFDGPWRAHIDVIEVAAEAELATAQPGDGEGPTPVGATRSLLRRSGG